MINGFEYAAEDMKVILPGSFNPEPGVVAAEYETEKEHVNIHGLAAEAVAMGRAKKNSKGKLVVLQSVIEGMQAALKPGQDLTDLAPFQVTIAYAPAGGKLTIDRWTYVRILRIPKSMKSGDTHMEVPLDVIIGKILYNNKV